VGLTFKNELIGPPGCPIFRRVTLWEARDGSKLLVHRFTPYADDRDVHDHPWGFTTVVLRGSYDDLVPCERCGGSGSSLPVRVGAAGDGSCPGCGGSGLVVGDHMRAGMIRRRRARHRHRTRVGPKGCLTIVLTGRYERVWGFWRGGRWLPWREYERRYGASLRCDDREVA